MLADGEHGLAGNAPFGQGGESVAQLCPGQSQAHRWVEPASGGQADQCDEVWAGWFGVCVGQVADQPRAFVAEEVVDADRRFLGAAGAEDDRSAWRDLAEASRQRRAADPVGDEVVQAVGRRGVGDHR